MPCLGSSPLARGLRHGGEIQNRRHGIIPARAGFTRSRPGWRHRHPDHPRSRGVYPPVYRMARGVQGSSPLARGLQSLTGSQTHDSGIIPARAGFTFGTERIREGRPDHPRSRGVYAVSKATRSPWPGSSPLARGLPGPLARPAGSLRIIPARAGFTRTALRRRERPAGSSPLARGLLRTALSRACSTPDHPRSRGVYRWAHLSCDPFGGSSPLARGLRLPGAPPAHDHGIIPARAGFTRVGAVGGGWGGDHPRSRGVYPIPHRRIPAILGSSPLARGLPVRMLLREKRGRIIPARAGFTRVGHRPGPEGGDHPRSRGVYRGGPAHRDARVGSSPLARGLPIWRSRSTRRAGIIPARAGFTAPAPRSASKSADHPRSRGVYHRASRPAHGRPGSSPLARGLPRCCLRFSGRAGIIPARAGFTP